MNLIDKYLGENNSKWFSDMNTLYKPMDKKTQVEIIWKPGQSEIKVQFRDIKTRQYIGHTMVKSQGMTSKEFKKHVDQDMKKIWKSMKR